MIDGDHRIEGPAGTVESGENSLGRLPGRQIPAGDAAGQVGQAQGEDVVRAG